jgi:hypothetical protein
VALTESIGAIADDQDRATLLANRGRSIVDRPERNVA